LDVGLAIKRISARKEVKLFEGCGVGIQRAKIWFKLFGLAKRRKTKNFENGQLGLKF